MIANMFTCLKIPVKNTFVMTVTDTINQLLEHLPALCFWKLAL
jgi:hypothetical protein